MRSRCIYVFYAILLKEFTIYILMDIVQLQTIHARFLEELEQSRMGKKTSLAFIANKLPENVQLMDGAIFQVMVIGGTIFRSVLLEKRHEMFRILQDEVKRLPKFSTKAIFFTFLSDHLYPQAKTLVLNFSFKMQPLLDNNKVDGILLGSSKGHLFEGLMGEKVGEEFEKYLLMHHRKALQVFVANDVVCLTLAGLMNYRWEHVAAGIIGTGLNFSLMLDATTVVNLESGAFDMFEPSPEGRIIDMFSSNKGKQLFEKEISGAYLYLHYNLKLKAIGGERMQITRTDELSRIALDGDDSIKRIARDVLERSAALVACQAAGILSFSKRDLTFIMQGSLFWDGYQYQETVRKYVKLLEPNYSADFVHIDHADIFGAAKLVG